MKKSGPDKEFMVSNGGALTTLLVTTHGWSFKMRLLEKAGSRGITESTWDLIDIFDLGIQENTG